MPFEATIAAFAAALCDAAAPPPIGASGREGASETRRFAVYRNNLVVGLIGALEARYPTVRRIMGAEAFRAIARAFVRAQKPRTPVLIDYGQAFPDFIAARCEEFGPPHLVDLARLENAWVEAYHAEEAPAATLSDLAALDAGALPNARIALHPAARLLRFATPAASFWASCQDDAKPPWPEKQTEDVLVARPHAEVSVRTLPLGGYAFASRLQEGATLAGAAESLPDADAFGSHLVGLVAAGAVQAILIGARS